MSTLPEEATKCRVCGETDKTVRCSACWKAHYCGKEHQKQAWKGHKFTCKAIKAPPPPPSQPLVLVYDSLKGEGLPVWQAHLKGELDKSATLLRVTSVADLIEYLELADPPLCVFVTEGSFINAAVGRFEDQDPEDLEGETRPQRLEREAGNAAVQAEIRKLSPLLKSYVKNGGRFIMGGYFPCTLSLGGTYRYFKDDLGLAWETGQYHRTTHHLQRHHPVLQMPIAAGGGPEFLLPSYSMKALHIKNHPEGTSLYLPDANSKTESHVFAPARVSRSESPSVMQKDGLGWWGFQGDVNGEEGTTWVILRMLGLKKQ